MNATHVEAAITDLWPSLPWDRLSKRQMQDVRRLLGLLPNRRPLANVLLSDIVRRHVSHLEAS